MTTSWADALTPDSLATEETGDRTVASAASTGSDWSFRLAAVRLGTGTYRLILGERRADGPGTLERDFAAALASLRLLRPGEAQAVRPRRISVVAARHGDTAAGLAARMSLEAPLERFLVMNGLERGEPLRPGERYKLVTE